MAKHAKKENIRKDILPANVLSLKAGKTYLKTRESPNIEFKKSFNVANIAEYGKDMAAFSNHSGGYLIFGVEDKPHIPVGLQNDRFNETDESVITSFLNDHFAPAVDWEKDIIVWKRKTFGVIHVFESASKPVMATSDAGKKQEIKSGEIYYRYVGRSEKVKYAELSQIIDNRLNSENLRWRELFQKIARIGPENATILNTLDGEIEEGNRMILIDNDLIKKIKFIKEGQFNEKEGALTLKLIGEIQPTSGIGVKQKIIHDDPFTLRE
jgi:predicted HTH transcriptional regulator